MVEYIRNKVTSHPAPNLEVQMLPSVPITSKHPKTLSQKQGISFQSQPGEAQPSSGLQKTYNITFDGVF